jgi:DNA polymerase elongation subunit (family B)
MARHALIYGLDIETDTTIDGLDPRVASVLTVALSLPGHDEVFSGPEPQLLTDLDHRLRTLAPGVLATWNGGAFDLPFLASRAQEHGIGLGLRLELDPRMRLRGNPLPGHEGAYRGAWFGHQHLDAYRLYRSDVGPLLRVSCSLKSIARLVGLSTIEVDRTRIHDLSHEALHAYAASDARLARVLTERRLPSAVRHVDRLAAPVAAQAPRTPAAAGPATRRPRQPVLSAN